MIGWANASLPSKAFCKSLQFQKHRISSFSQVPGQPDELQRLKISSSPLYVHRQALHFWAHKRLSHSEVVFRPSWPVQFSKRAQRIQIRDGTVWLRCGMVTNIFTVLSFHFWFPREMLVHFSRPTDLCRSWDLGFKKFAPTPASSSCQNSGAEIFSNLKIIHGK